MNIKTSLAIPLITGLSLLSSCGTQSTPPQAKAKAQSLSTELSCLYEHLDYTGEKYCFSKEEGWTGTDGTRLLEPKFDDKVTSVKLAPGVSAELFEHPDYTGRSIKLNESSPNLVPLGMNDQMTSFRFTLDSVPPQNMVDKYRPDQPVLRRAYYDNDLVIYLGEGISNNALWIKDLTRAVWSYVRDQYGPYGPERRLYVFIHSANKRYGVASILNRFDPRSGYHNVLTIGNYDMENPGVEQRRTIMHEIAHIVEGASNDTNESPSFLVWKDGPWPQLAIYDFLLHTNKADEANAWLNEVMNSKHGTYHSQIPGEYYTMRDWFYPIYSKYGGNQVIKKYFSLIAKCYPTIVVTTPDQVSYKSHEGYFQSADGSVVRAPLRMNPGEFVHFWSGAAGVNLKEQFTKAYKWDDQIEQQFQQARQQLTCANTY